MNKLHTPELIAQRAEIQSVYALACEADRNQSGRMSGTVDHTERSYSSDLWDQHKKLSAAYSVSRAKALAN